MPQRTRITPEQQLVMVEFLEKHPDLVRGRAKNPSAAKKVKMLWHILTKKLNGVEGGVKKTSAMWTKTWWDKKWFLKKILLQHGLEKRNRGCSSRVQWSPLDMRVYNLLLQSGEVSEVEIDSTAPFSASIKNAVARTEHEKESTSLPHALPPSENGDENLYSEYLDSSISLNGDLEDSLERETRAKYSKKIINPSKIFTSTPRNEPDTLQTEFSRVAFVEEKRLEVEERSSKAREDVADAINRCASAMEALAGAVSHQGTVISDALRAQGESIADALKIQGDIIARALANR